MDRLTRISFPKQAMGKADLLNSLVLAKKNDLKWEAGKSFCLIYYPGDDKAQMIKDAYNLYFTENALNPMSFPSLRKYETEIVSMIADLLNGNEKVSGSFTSGGTESILLSLKTARDYFREIKPKIKQPEIILPLSAHPAFEKGCQYFNIKPVFIGLDDEYKADLNSLRKAISTNTIMLVASAPSYPQGVIDPIEEFAKVALENKLLFHVDTCIGGCMLPFMEKLGYTIPVFDFRVEGVTSMSVDLHKYGYAAKGASVILYKDDELRKSQFFVSTSWPGGIYGSTTLAGSRPGGSIAAAYAAIMGIGEVGYMQLAEKTMEVTRKIKKAIEKIPQLQIMGNPSMSILAFKSTILDIYELADELNIRGWHFERLQNPAGLHLTINQIHEISADQFIVDLNFCVEKVKKTKMSYLAKKIKIALLKRLIKILPNGTLARIQSQFSGRAAASVRTAPMYGMMGALQGTKDLDEIVLDVLDKLNKA